MPGVIIPYGTYTDWLVDMVGDEDTRLPQPHGGDAHNARMDIKTLNVDGMFWSRGVRIMQADHHKQQIIRATRCRGWGVCYSKTREATVETIEIQKGGAHLTRPDGNKDAANFGLIDTIGTDPDIRDYPTTVGGDFLENYSPTNAAQHPIPAGTFVYYQNPLNTTPKGADEYYVVKEGVSAPLNQPPRITNGLATNHPDYDPHVLNSTYWRWMRTGDEPNQVDIHRLVVGHSGGRYIEVNGTRLSGKLRGLRFYECQIHYLGTIAKDGTVLPYDKYTNGRSTTLRAAAVVGGSTTVLPVHNALGYLPEDINGDRFGFIEWGWGSSSLIDEDNARRIVSVDTTPGAHTITIENGAGGTNLVLDTPIRGWVEVPTEGTAILPDGTPNPDVGDYQLIRLNQCDDVHFRGGNTRSGDATLGVIFELGQPGKALAPDNTLGNVATNTHLDSAAMMTGIGRGFRIHPGSSARVDCLIDVPSPSTKVFENSENLKIDDVRKPSLSDPRQFIVHAVADVVEPAEPLTQATGTPTWPALNSNELVISGDITFREYNLGPVIFPPAGEVPETVGKPLGKLEYALTSETEVTDPLAQAAQIELGRSTSRVYPISGSASGVTLNANPTIAAPGYPREIILVNVGPGFIRFRHDSNGTTSKIFLGINPATGIAYVAGATYDLVPNGGAMLLRYSTTLGYWCRVA
jgi:hypothetical protein